MPLLLIVNPNTSASVSALLERQALAHCPAGIELRVETARFGPRYITGEIGSAVAGHAALDAYAHAIAAGARPDAVLLGCFGDPGLHALRALSPAPVLGLAEAAMRRAAANGPFVVVTGGPAWAPILLRLAASLALPSPLLGVQAVARSGGDLAGADDAAAVLQQASREALVRWPQARAVLLGGAGLAGLAPAVADGLAVPVIDNVQAALEAACIAAFDAVRDAEARVALLGERARPAAPEVGPWAGLPEPLADLLNGLAARGLA